MKNSSNLLEPIVAISKKILRKSLIIIILLSLFTILYAVYSVNQLLNVPDDEAYRTEKQSDSVRTRFDQDTISKLDRLRARQEQSSPSLPAGRINPFVE
jgi:hypothetical protein